MRQYFLHVLQEFVCDIIIFLFKAGEALLDSTIRPYIITVVCSDIFSNIQFSEVFNDEKWHSDIAETPEQKLDTLAMLAIQQNMLNRSNQDVCRHIDDFSQVRT